MRAMALRTSSMSMRKPQCASSGHVQRRYAVLLTQAIGASGPSSSRITSPSFMGLAGGGLRLSGVFPAAGSGVLRRLFGVLLQEHWEAGNARYGPFRIRTFDFEHEGVAAIKAGEQHFEDAIGRIPLAFDVDRDRAF